MHQTSLKSDLQRIYLRDSDTVDRSYVMLGPPITINCSLDKIAQSNKKA